MHDSHLLGVFGLASGWLKTNKKGPVSLGNGPLCATRLESLVFNCFGQLVRGAWVVICFKSTTYERLKFPMGEIF
jgi:hypothetical protein